MDKKILTQPECGFSWAGNKGVVHNCKLSKGHPDDHQCKFKYRETSLEAPCRARRQRGK